MLLMMMKMEMERGGACIRVPEHVKPTTELQLAPVGAASELCRQPKVHGAPENGQTGAPSALSAQRKSRCPCATTEGPA